MLHSETKCTKMLHVPKCGSVAKCCIHSNDACTQVLHEPKYYVHPNVECTKNCIHQKLHPLKSSMDQNVSCTKMLRAQKYCKHLRAIISMNLPNFQNLESDPLRICSFSHIMNIWAPKTSFQKDFVIGPKFGGLRVFVYLAQMEMWNFLHVWGCF